MTERERWAYADRISDQIVDILNAEVKKPDFSVIQVLAGQLLALSAFVYMTPRHAAPPSLVALMKAVQDCLKSMMEEMERKAREKEGAQ